MFIKLKFDERPSIPVVIFAIILVLAIEFLVVIGLSWVICWAFVLPWSFQIGIGVWAAAMLLALIFKINTD